MKAFYFGPHSDLFGVYETPPAPSRPPRAVVACYPIAQEGVRAHRAFRQLALRLARSGTHTLRFDYYGSGDSLGESDESSADRWVQDIASAIDELKALSGATRVALIGLRLGATLAGLAASERSDVTGLVAWEPFPDGAECLRNMSSEHRAWLRRHAEALGQAMENDDGREALGFPLTETMRASIESMDLAALARRPSPHVLLVESVESPASARLKQAFTALGARVDHAVFRERAIWKLRPRDQAVVPPQTLERIVEWLGATER